jgi:hypothetical protein
MSFLSGLATQPATLALGAGLLAGVVTGTAVVATGVLSSPPPEQLALVSCPGTDDVVARVTSGQSMLVTARSGDGAWLRLYIGEPGLDSAWAPASALRVGDPVDGLPVAGCEVAVGPSSEPTPAVTAVVLPTPTPSPLPSGVTPPPPTPTPIPTPTPKPTPTKSLPPGVTAAPPTPTPTPLPPPPTIPPTPTPSPTPPPPPPNDPPLAYNLARSVGCIDHGAYPSSVVTVTATDPNPGDVLTVKLRLGYRYNGLQYYRLGSFTMAPAGGNQFSYTIYSTDLHSYNFDQNYSRDVEVTYDVTAYDQAGGVSGTVYSHNLSATQLFYNALSTCSVG